MPARPGAPHCKVIVTYRGMKAQSCIVWTVTHSQAIHAGGKQSLPSGDACRDCESVYVWSQWLRESV